MQSSQCLRLLVLVLMVTATAANATRRRRNDWKDMKEQWKDCVSEGGTKECAECKGTDGEESWGGLDCGAWALGSKYENCPDWFEGARKDKAPKFFIMKTSGEASCSDFYSQQHDKSATVAFHGWDVDSTDSSDGDKKGIMIPDADKLLPGCDGTFNGPHIISKAIMEHPKFADKKYVALVYKRIVLHPHSKTNLMVADVFKVGLCVQCQTDVVSRASYTFGSAEKKALDNKAKNEDDAKNEAFETAVDKAKQAEQDTLNNCLTKAFTTTKELKTELKTEYRCDNKTTSYQHYQSLLVAF